MKALDANILIRFLVKDDERQSKKVYILLKQAEEEKIEFYVPLLVLIEIIWVLESAYDISRDDIIESIGELLAMPILKFESQDIIRQSLNYSMRSKINLSDILIACSAKNSGCERVVTFDKKVSKFKLFELLE